jgi:hypothetical protein
MSFFMLNFFRNEITLSDTFKALHSSSKWSCDRCDWWGKLGFVCNFAFTNVFHAKNVGRNFGVIDRIVTA